MDAIIMMRDGAAARRLRRHPAVTGYRVGVADADELFEAIDRGDADRVRELVAAEPELAAARDAAGVSAIMRARYRNDRPVLDALLATDLEPDVFESASLGRLDRLTVILDDDPAFASAWSADGFGALHVAAYFAKPLTAKLLIERGAPVDAYARGEQHVQPLHSAAAGGHHEICRLLLDAGADVRARQTAGWTVLHQAAQHGDPQLVELFLSAGADPGAENDAGETAAETAEAAGHPDVAARLRQVMAGAQ
jgi:ankyrin repeat protein